MMTREDISLGANLSKQRGRRQDIYTRSSLVCSWVLTKSKAASAQWTGPKQEETCGSSIMLVFCKPWNHWSLSTLCLFYSTIGVDRVALGETLGRQCWSRLLFMYIPRSADPLYLLCLCCCHVFYKMLLRNRSCCLFSGSNNLEVW